MSIDKYLNTSLYAKRWFLKLISVNSTLNGLQMLPGTRLRVSLRKYLVCFPAMTVYTSKGLRLVKYPQERGGVIHIIVI